MAYKRNRKGSIIMEDGNTITRKQENEIREKVKQANRIRQQTINRFYKQVKDTPSMKGISKSAYEKILSDHKMITQKYSYNMNQFKNKKDMLGDLKELKGVTKKGYTDSKMENIRKDMIARSNKNYGSEGRPIRNRLKQLSNEQLTMLYMNDDELMKLIYDSDQDMDVDEYVEYTLGRIDKGIQKLGI